MSFGAKMPILTYFLISGNLEQICYCAFHFLGFLKELFSLHASLVVSTLRLHERVAQTLTQVLPIIESILEIASLGRVDWLKKITAVYHVF